MIHSETPYKLAEVIRDTWPMIYRPPKNINNRDESTEETIDNANNN